MAQSDMNTSGHKEDTLLEALFRHARARQRAPADVEERIYEALHAEWRQSTQRRSRRFRFAALAVAASLVLALLWFALVPRTETPGNQEHLFVSVEKAIGKIFVRDATGRLKRLTDSEQLLSGQSLITRQGSGIALRWGDGESLRLDENSRVELLAGDQIRLIHGRLYVDSSAANDLGAGLIIRTPAGLVSHLGTQYMISVSDSGTDISVRKGKVSIVTGKVSTVTDKGSKISVDRDGHRRMTDIETYGDVWRWTEQLAPPFNMDGRTMEDFLAWVGYETGHSIKYASASAREMARKTRLHGNAELAPLRALEVVLQTSDLVYRLHAGTIVISTRTSA